MKHIFQPLLGRTVPHKIKGKDRVKSTAKTVQFVDVFPSNKSMMQQKSIIPFSHLDTKKMGAYTVFIPHSLNILP